MFAALFSVLSILALMLDPSARTPQATTTAPVTTQPASQLAWDWPLDRGDSSKLALELAAAIRKASTEHPLHDSPGESYYHSLRFARQPGLVRRMRREHQDARRRALLRQRGYGLVALAGVEGRYFQLSAAAASLDLAERLFASANAGLRQPLPSGGIRTEITYLRKAIELRRSLWTSLDSARDQLAAGDAAGALGTAVAALDRSGVDAQHPVCQQLEVVRAQAAQQLSANHPAP